MILYTDDDVFPICDTCDTTKKLPYFRGINVSHLFRDIAHMLEGIFIYDEISKSELFN